MIQKIHYFQKNCETLIKETNREAEETLENKMIKPRETFHFNPSINLGSDSNWMVRLLNLQVYNSFYNITEENNQFKFYKVPDSKIGGVSYEKVKDEIEKDLEITDITAADLQDEKIGPIIIDEYREQVTKRMENGGCMKILAGYHSSVFQDFEAYLRTEIDLIEDDIGLILDK